MNNKYDVIIIGGGLFGVYSAYYLSHKNKDLKIAIIESEDDILTRASKVNQARVHMGYHYPRSISTALDSIKYFNRFYKDFEFAINSQFTKIYAISDSFSSTDTESFKSFCKNADIPFEEVDTKNYFNGNVCSSAFITKEFSFDFNLIRNFYLKELDKIKQIDLKFNSKVTGIKELNNLFLVQVNNAYTIESNYVLNCTYASTNQILKMYEDTPLNLKYELCEVILCNVSDNLKDIGITVMDGPFFSIMPFGKTPFHSLTAVEYTPHKTSLNNLPTFDCQSKTSGKCSSLQLDSCNNCQYKPNTNWDHMLQISHKYLHPKFLIKYEKSLFTIKTIMANSEIDDSRPTIICRSSKNNKFISVLSGKINTIYDLESMLDEI